MWRSSSTRWCRNASFAALALTLVGACDRAAPPDRLKVGGAVPPLLLESLDGQKSALSAYRGRLVVLNVWATWCPPCRKELPSLQRLSERLDSAGYAVVGVAGDDDARLVREYLLDKQVTFPNYLDANLERTIAALGMATLPYTLIVAPDGRVVARLVGEREWDTPDMVAALAQARREGAAAEGSLLAAGAAAKEGLGGARY